MSRLETKCLMVCATTHGLLIAIVFFGSAFFVANTKKENLQPLNMIPAILVDAAISGGGGKPNLHPSEEKPKGETLIPQPPAPQPPVQKPVEAKPPPEPKPTEVKKEPPTVVKKTTESNKPLKPQPKEPIPEPRHKVDINNVVKRPDDTAAKAKAQAEAQARERAARAQHTAEIFKEASSRLASGFAGGTAIEVPGPGGAAYANYAQLVKAAYDDAWKVSDEMTDNNSVATVTVVIGRSGDVITAQITTRSGNPALDRSVQRAIDKVRFIAPFPTSAKEAERTFTIEFNLKTKRAFG
jgi:TonB family protein